MADEFDINEIAAAFIQKNMETFLELGKGIFKTTSHQVRLHLDRTYKAYLANVLEKYSKAKSFFIRNEPVYLYGFYVPLSVCCRGVTIERPGLSDITKFSRSTVIVGSGGSGKSMFMRHLLLNSVLTKQKVPVFIELRQFNQNGNDLITLILQGLAAHKFEVDQEYVNRAIESGHFAFFFDGFDEIIQSKRQTATKSIQDFAKKYDRNFIIMSSRPDSSLESWPDFSVLQLAPLTLEQACNLITPLPYDEELKSKFVGDLRSGLFIKHESFLSNPLLLSIMLLTYGQSANIPNKLNVFYNQAYEALFERHDALKAGFQRQRRTKLDIQDFAKAFSAFCLQTYDMRQFEFTRTGALDYIEKAQKIVRLDYDKDDYLKDCLQAVCLLVEEGLMIVFAHRSFQEYFTARFIAEARADIQKKLIGKYSRNLETDNVMSLLYEIRPEIVEQHLILPALDTLFLGIGVKKTVGISHYTRYIKQIYSSFEFHKDHLMIGLKDIRNRRLILFTLMVCGHHVGWDGFRFSSEERIPFINKHFKEKIEIAEIATAGLSSRDSFLRDLAELSGEFSIRTLRLLYEIRKVLREKTRLAESSLDEILMNK